MKKRLSIKNDLLLLILLLVIGFLIPPGYRLFHRTAGNTVTITINGELWRTLPLSTDTTIEIPGRSGTNTLCIKNGQASITEADCPDKLCVHQVSIQHNGESLVCLPHKVIVKVTANASDRDLDGIAK